LAYYVASEYSELTSVHFPFHKLGKTILLNGFKRLAEDPPVQELNKERNEELGRYVGKPLTNDDYKLFSEGKFSDLTLDRQNKKYSVHKCILTSESLYFASLLNSEWIETNESILYLPPEKNISTEAFEVFLLFLNTNLIEPRHFKKHLLELFELSDYFQVSTLAATCEKGTDLVQRENSGENLFRFSRLVN
jgi:hypothetical protein